MDEPEDHNHIIMTLQFHFASDTALFLICESSNPSGVLLAK